MANNNISIGFHVKKVSSLEPKEKFKSYPEAILHYFNQGINTFQIYSHVPQSSRKMNLKFEEIKKLVEEKNINLYCHASYPTISIFKYERVDRLESELKSASLIGAKGVVIHIGKNSPEQIVEVFKKYKNKLQKYKVPILIENSAYSNNKKNKSNKNNNANNNNNNNNDNDNIYNSFLCNSVENINKLYKLLKDNFSKDYIMGCIDTAHLFSAGVNPKEWTKINLSNIKLIHFNGSERKFGSGVDKHSIPFNKEDNIDKKDLLAFINKAKNKDIVIEPNRGKLSDLMLAIKEVKK